MHKVFTSSVELAGETTKGMDGIPVTTQTLPQTKTELTTSTNHEKKNPKNEDFIKIR